ncbi:MAG: phage tail tape measure protein [Allorhizobium sp.]|uniref:phage tail tape measure protein n=1 Tax=Allorhizobium sp. TaxID=633478 RepID=UPI004033A299
MSRLTATMVVDLTDKTGGKTRAIIGNLDRLKRAERDYMLADKGLRLSNRDRAMERLMIERERSIAERQASIMAWGSRAGLATTALGYGAMQAFRSSAQLEREIGRIVINADKGRDAIDPIVNQLRKIADDNRMPFENVVDGFRTLIASGRELEEALEFLPSVSLTAQASGSAVADIGLTADAVAGALKVTSGEMQKAFDQLVEGGKLGKFELNEMAQYLPTIAPAFAALGYEGTEGLAKLVAMLQTVRMQTGTSAEAATNFENVINKIYSGETARKFQKNFGINLPKALDETRTFDDTDGAIDLDMEGKSIELTLNGVSAFLGTVETARSQGSRGGGRVVPVTAKGFDTRGKAKQAQAFHMDDATLGDFLGEAGRQAGLTIEVDPSLASIVRDYWSADYESVLDLGEKIAREVNGTFKIRGNKAVLVPRGGVELPTVQGIVGQGGNVISWDIAPFTGRPAFTKAKARWFDRKAATFREEEVEIDLGRDLPDSENIIRMPAGDAAQAKLRAEGRKSEAERDAGGGTVELDLTPEAQAEAPFTLTGARRGVDGTWRIVSVTHKANRAGGATTSLEIKEPGAAAGGKSRSSTPATPANDGGDDDTIVVLPD